MVPVKKDRAATEDDGAAAAKRVVHIRTEAMPEDWFGFCPREAGQQGRFSRKGDI
jgi:hypothetical protein